MTSYQTARGPLAGLSGLQVNSRVRVKQGLLMNYQGILVEVQGNKARVRIETLGVQLSAQFDKRNLEAVR
ncbi:MAG: hypothetical protein EOP49_12145 [Sphingobacteriales bacterium]|nr:MAG: hypothetical protein EOP49_12145 [Sphingobacteriales bacterium]